jgi:DNA-binding LytR/AlgR family response regulator
MIRCIIIDDEYLAIKLLEELARQHSDLEVVQTFTNSREGLHGVHHTKPDLIFLDIQMPYLDGLELVQQLDYKPMIIFTTARHDFAVKAFELDILDYLVKPIAADRFEKAVQKAREYQQYRLQKTQMPAPEYLMVKADYRITKINFAGIIYIEGLNEYVKIHTLEKKYIVLASLKDLQQQLPGHLFVRIHKSYIIARACIDSYSAAEVVLKQGIQLPVGRKYKDDFLK